MAHRKTLTQVQLDLLEWIADGCPDGVIEGTHHRISAAALQRRGYVKVRGRGPTWEAQITPAGEAHLAEAKQPNATPPRQANVSVTQQLIDDLVAAGGSMRVPEKRWGQRDGVDFRQRVLFAERHGKVPSGKRLKLTSLSHDELQIELVDAAEGVPDLRPVPVPDAVSRYHGTVKQFRERSDRHEVSRASLPRVSRLLQALVTEAERRGYTTSLVPGTERNHYRRDSGWTGPNNGHLILTVNDFSAAIRVTEEGLPSRVHWERTNRDYSWSRLGYSEPRRPPLTDYEAKATGQICLEIVSGFGAHGRPGKFADRKSWTLDCKLPELLHEIEVRAAEAAERQRKAEQEAEEREREWKIVRERAFARHAEAVRGQVLRAEVERWREVSGIRAYCDAAEKTHGDDVGTMDWVRWARAYAVERDPLHTAPQIPPAPESVPADELRPFMEGWDVHAPHRRGW